MENVKKRTIVIREMVQLKLYLVEREMVQSKLFLKFYTMDGENEILRATL